jgi:MoxR-like ATPase
LRAAKGQAFLAGRAYVAPQDVKDVFLDVMRHRIAVSYEAEAEDLTSDAVLSKILGTVAVP